MAPRKPVEPEVTTPAEPEVTTPVEPDVTVPADDVEPEDPKLDTTEKEYLVAVSIRGLRNGRPWPTPGQTIKLPTHEGEQYKTLGYVAELDA